MSQINPNTTLKPLRVAILTVSDTRKTSTDTSGDILAQGVHQAGHRLADRAIVADEIHAIRKITQNWIDSGNVDVIVSTGGTGLTGRDVTPQALVPLYDRQMDGFSFAFHSVSMESIGLSTMLSRACAGVIGKVVLFSLPGSNGAVRDGWNKIIAPIIDSRHQPCNLAQLTPRMTK